MNFLQKHLYGVLEKKLTEKHPKTHLQNKPQKKTEVGVFSPLRDALGGACPTAPNGYV
jgi:hypothetical protein